jgi:hypothetical protein
LPIPAATPYWRIKSWTVNTLVRVEDANSPFSVFYKGKVVVRCSPRGDREKNSPTAAYACRKRRLKWVLLQVGGWSTGLETLSL